MTTLFGNTAVIAITAPKKKLSLLPLLTILFLVSYGLMTMLIVEQGSVIQSQRNLIQVLMSDSRELWGMKGQAVAKAGQNHAQGKSTPSPQTQSDQFNSTQAPSTQVAPQPHTQSRPGRTAKPAPQAPAMPASDLADQRRTLHSI